MTGQTLTKKDDLYSFRGKAFLCDVDTIARLNYALALNHSDERYVRAIYELAKGKTFTDPSKP